MIARHVGLLTMLLVGCAHKQPTHHAEAPHEEKRVARENAAEEKRAEIAADQREHSAAAYGTTPDNTRVNERDREPTAVTPLDQGSSDRDVELTAQIRKAMVGDSSLSFTAKNTKIITRDGLVTLRGTVVNTREKETIHKTALSIAGKDHVVDELEVEQ
ncbi:MAG TPA: BON domain-containing protein [Polyangiales bacterium]|nr:BON domain-containing protein [Polyangiales bacterium]